MFVVAAVKFKVFLFFFLRTQKQEKPIKGTLFSYFKKSPLKQEKVLDEAETSQEPSQKKAKF